MDYLSFKLPDDFVKAYEKKKVKWGYDVGGGNTLGELTYATKYSRRKEDGTKERWHETCRRVTEGHYSILKDFCKTNKTPWNEFKAQKAAQDSYDRMFNFKWLPPGRGLWSMGTQIVNGERNSANLYNCAFCSTEKLSTHSAGEATRPFVRLMDMSLNGIGVGFDTAGAGNLTLHEPTGDPEIHVVGDSREGWVESVHLLLCSYFFKNRRPVKFDYSEIREKGQPLIRSGGVAPGPGPLIDIHTNLIYILGNREGELLTTLDIIDINNILGKGSASGGIRRSAEICLGNQDDDDFMNAKDWNVNPIRMGEDGWGHLSNNSIIASVGEDMSRLVEKIQMNGEPGIFYRDLVREYGRLKDPMNKKDEKVLGCNPCGEVSLESYEVCNINETFPNNHDSLEDYLRTLKCAYLYSKAVTLLPTPWEETNEIVTRNRRIGTSMSGIVQFIESRGWNELRKWCDAGYAHIQQRDKQYSEWLGIRESIKTTTVKPSGTVSLLCGATPGVHWPVENGYYIRRQRFTINDPIVEAFKNAGYHVEPDVMDPKFSVVVSFPAKGQNIRSEKEVTLWEKMSLASMMQKWWSDNSVSATFTFQDNEKEQISQAIKAFEGELKTLSFLPISTKAYKQMPYEAITEEEATKMLSGVKKIESSAYYGKNSSDAKGEKFCDGDKCVL